MVQKTVVVSILLLFLLAGVFSGLHYDERISASMQDAEVLSKTANAFTSTQGVRNPVYQLSPQNPPVTVASIEFCPPQSLGTSIATPGITGRPWNKGYVQAGSGTECWITALLNSNLDLIFDANPNGFPDPPGTPSGTGRREFTSRFIDAMNACIAMVNQDLNPDGTPNTGNDIDLTNGVSPFSDPAGTTSPEAQSLLNCKNIVLDSYRPPPQLGGSPTGGTTGGTPPTTPPTGGTSGGGLIIPPNENFTNYYIYHPGVGPNGIVFTGRTNWCERLRDALNAGDGAIMGLQDSSGSSARNHVVTVVGVNCTTNPRTIRVLDTSGTGVEIDLQTVQDPNSGRITITNSNQVGMNQDATVIGIVGIG